MSSLRSCIKSCLSENDPHPHPPRPIPPRPHPPAPYDPDDDGYLPYPDDEGGYHPPIPPPRPIPDDDDRPRPDDNTSVLRKYNQACKDRQFVNGFDQQNMTCSLKGVSAFPTGNPCSSYDNSECCRNLDTCISPYFDQNGQSIGQTPSGCRKDFDDCKLRR